MNKFYCNICGKDVTLKDGKCPDCKTDWDKIINNNCSDDIEPLNIYKGNDIKDEKIIEEEYTNVKTNNRTNIDKDIDDNINFFLTSGRIGKIYMIVISIIIAIISFIGIESTEGLSLLLLIVSASIIGSAIIFENNLKWKAYMLYTNAKRKK